MPDLIADILQSTPLRDLSAPGSLERPAKSKHIDDILAATPAAQPRPDATADQPTVPESPATLQVQMTQLSKGDRNVVMFPKGTPVPPLLEKTPTHTDAFGNVYAYDPDKIQPTDIDAAVASNRLPQILGDPKAGMGAPDKSLMQGPLMAVVSRTMDGTTVQSTATDQANMQAAVDAAKKITPRGGKVTVEPADNEIANREASNANNPSLGGQRPAAPAGGGSLPGQQPPLPQGNGPGIIPGLPGPGTGGPLGGQPQSDAGNPLPNTGRRVTGSADVQLVPEGVRQAQKLARSVPPGVQVFHAPNDRSTQSARIISPTAQPADWLEPWKLGAHEGKPLATERDAINDRILNQPDASPGVSPYSGEVGESFNQVRQRLIGGAQEQGAAMSPGAKALNITSGRALQIIDAWAKAGKPPDGSVDLAAMTKDAEFSKPGQLFRLDASGLRPITKISGPGQYFAQHGATQWNEKQVAPQTPPPASRRGVIQNAPAVTKPGAAFPPDLSAPGPIQ